MFERISHREARSLLLARCPAPDSERVPLSRASGRVLAEDLRAAEDVPPFNRSPYDGYAFRAADTQGASREYPVTLKILEEIAAGSIPTKIVTYGTASKILTGAPVPHGADAVVRFEDTHFTDTEVTLFDRMISGENIIYAGEDVKAGDLLAENGASIDPALAGTLAGQGAAEPLVYRIPKIGIISTGSELVEITEKPSGGSIRNTNRYTLEAACLSAGASPVYLGSACDSTGDITALMEAGLSGCDMVVSTGGVSVGDYDLTFDALERTGAEILIRNIQLKPGGACAYGIRDGRLVCCLSGNPASAMTNFYTLVLPCIRRLCGHRRAEPREIRVVLAEAFKKKTGTERLLRGRLDLRSGRALLHIGKQGNVMLNTMIGCDVLAIVPKNSPPLPAGTELDAYLLD